MNDAAIAALYRDRSEDAIRETEKKYGALCLRLARSILQNEEDAKECVNDAYLALWSIFPRREPTHLRAYLCRTVRNLALDRLRENAADRRGAPPLPLEELAAILPDPSSPEREFDERELTAALNRFLHGLPQKRRYIFMRRYFYCDSVGEIAAALGTSASAVSVTLNRLKKKLKEYLRKEGFSV